MPYRRADAPPTVPDEETIEWLLNHQNLESKRSRTTKMLDELSEEERNQTGLVKLGERTKTVQGDPFGTFPAWAGNVAHPTHYRMGEVLHPLLDKIFATKRKEHNSIASIHNFLTRVPNTDPQELARDAADLHSYNVVLDTTEELTLTFEIAGHSVRLIQAKDMDKGNIRGYDNTDRARSAHEEELKLLNDRPMSVELQQYMMANILEARARLGPSRGYDQRSFTALRAQARERYWLILTEEERAAERAALQSRNPTGTYIDLVRANWQPGWNNGARDTDYFRQYLQDQEAAKHVWKTVEEEVLIVIDKNRHVLFASLDKLAQFLYGSDLVDLITRALDMWSFYAPIPVPETARHFVDNHIRRIHPELDPSKATVEQLPNAKMGIAHYGCWASKGDPQGHTIHPSRDTRFTRSQDLIGPASFFPSLCDSVFAKTSDLVRFLMQTLDPQHYQECCEVWKKLPRNIPIKTSDEDFLTLFVLGVNGYTQRHKDINDVAGGLAGLCTFGNYTGGALCLPQLGLKVPYTPGTCAIIRGDGLEHLVQDYSGPRFFVIGTNHESVRRHGLRMMGKLPPLPPRPGPGKRLRDEDEVVERYQGPCDNRGEDGEDEIRLTNTTVHGPGALYPSSGSSITRVSSES